MSETQEVLALLSAGAVRERAHEMLALCEAGSLAHWRVHRERIAAAADYVLDTIRRDYPTLDIPFHARWRHFQTPTGDRGAPYGPLGESFDKGAARSRAAFDLAVVSVLLDAGAGPLWRYRTREGGSIGRSEGLAIASVDMFEAGLFSSSETEPRRVDAKGLARLGLDRLRGGFQASESNPLEGLEGRLALLHGLARALVSRPDLFPNEADQRPGALFDRLSTRANGGRLPAPLILATLLDAFGSVWPGRIAIGGVSLGDTWRHTAIRRAGAADGLVPFHKLSQWMAYSLVEPLQWGGVEVADIDGLTGLPEYRNGGLFIDLGVLEPKQPEALAQPHAPGDPMIVEWRALTVALLDILAARLREKLGMDAEALPLARVLQGGTWSAGRKIARELREDGAPPLAIVSDGTVF